MKTFTQWLKARIVKEDQSAYTGQLKGRPAGGAFSANRSQLWGPSATYGRADQRTPADWPLQIPQAWISAYGSALKKAIDRDIETVPNLEPPPTQEQTVDMAIVLPLQLPPQEFVGMINKGNARGKLQAVRQIIANCFGQGPQSRQSAGVSISYMGGQGRDENNSPTGDSQGCGFRFPDLGTHEEMEMAESFTKLLMQHFAIESLVENGLDKTLDLYDPKITAHYGEETTWTDAEGQQIPIQYLEAIFQFGLRDNSGWARQQFNQATRDRMAQQDMDGLWDNPQQQPQPDD